MQLQHLRQTTVVLLRLCDVHCIICQVVINNHFSYSVIFQSALYDALFEIAIKPKNLPRDTST